MRPARRSLQPSAMSCMVYLLWAPWLRPRTARRSSMPWCTAASTSGVEPGRRPIARGRDEDSEEAVYRSNPQLTKLLRSEFSAIIVGHRRDAQLHYYLAPGPARTHGFVYTCSPEEVGAFSLSFDFLTVLLNTHLSVPGEEVAGAALRR